MIPKIRIILGFHATNMREHVRMLMITAAPYTNFAFFPEGDYHPRDHAGMADRLTVIAESTIVATHSEVIVLRLRRLIAEGKMPPDQLAITWLGTGQGVPVDITVDAMGDVSWWPAGVFSEDFQEVKAIRRAQKKIEELHLALQPT